MRRSLISALSAATVALLLGLSAASAGPSRAANIDVVDEIELPGATHLEFFTRTIDGVERTFAMAGSRADSLHLADVPAGKGGAGLNIIEVTDPTNPVLRSNIPCVNTGGALDPAFVPFDPPRTIDGVVYDGVIAIASNDALVPSCRMDASFNRPPAGCVGTCLAPYVRGRGLSIIGVRQAPLSGEVVSFTWFGGDIIKNAAGGIFDWVTVGDPAAHTVVPHPTQPIFYSGNQNLGDRSPTVEVTDVRSWPPVARSIALPPTGVGPHDITFRPDGKRAYASSINTSFIWDTTDPANPVTLTTVTSPNLKIHHEAVLHPNGRHLIIVDEFVATSGTGNNPQCPGGGLHIFDLGPDHALERAPVLVGQFYAPDLSTPLIQDPGPPPATDVNIACTAHEYAISGDGSWTPMAWMGAGVRTLDLSSLNAAAQLPAPTPVVVTELGYHIPSGTDVWAAKAHPNTGDHIFVTDTAGWFRVLKRTA